MISAIDVETTYHKGNFPWMESSYLVSVSIVNEEGRFSWLINHPEATKTHEECRREIQEIINRSSRIVGHNIKFDLHWLHHFNLSFDLVRLYCTQVAEYIIKAQPRLDNLSLNDLAATYGLPLKKDLVKTYWDAGYETDEIPANILNEYCEHDTDLALQIYQLQLPIIEEQNQLPLIAVEMESVRTFQEMEYNGMLLDTELLNQYREEYTARLEEMDTELANLLGIQNISSGDQLSCGLYGGTYKIDGRVPGKRPGTMKNGKVDVTVAGAGFKPPAGSELKKPGFYGTSIDVLTQLKPRNKLQRHIKELLMERSRIDQLNKTYFKGLSERVYEDGRVHPNINQTLTATGRLSCSQPNLQNQPRGNTGPVKRCFITRF